MAKHYYPLLLCTAFVLILICFPSSINGQQKEYQSRDILPSSTACIHPPKITCPELFESCPGVSADPDVTGHAIAIAAQPECGIPVLNFTDNVLQQSSCNGGIYLQRIWTALDPSDPELKSVCIQYINSLDNRAPEFINCPRDTQILTNANCVGVYRWNMPGVVDECANYCIKTSHPNGVELSIGRHNIVITATDECGNESSCSFFVDVVENCCQNSPTLHCPSDYNSCPGGNIDPGTTGMATADKGAGNCGIPIISFSDRVIKNELCSKIIERTWIAADSMDPQIFTSCTQLITLEDNERPEFISCPPNITVQSDDDCKATVSWTEARAQDNCGIQSIVSSLPSGYRFALGVSAVNVIATDFCGNTKKCEFLVKVEQNCCKDKPILNCPPEFSACPKSSLEPAITGHATAFAGNPNCSQPIISYRDEILFQSDCRSLIYRIWTATDPEKNELKDSCIQRIILKDEEAPEFRFCPANITVESDDHCFAQVSWPDPVAVDGCGSVSLFSSFNSGDQFQIGTTAVDVEAEDECGNISTCTFYVKVEENCCKREPILSCPADYTACPGTSILPGFIGEAIATPGSIKCKQPIISYTDEIILNSACSTVINRIWTAVDSIFPELKSSCTQQIILEDKQAPQFTFCPPDVTMLSDDKCVNEFYWSDPQAEDLCGAVTITSSVAKGFKFQLGTTAVLLTATDDCGNSSTCEFLVTVLENCCNEPAVLNCPVDYIGCSGSSLDTAITGTAWADPFQAVCQQAEISYVDDVIIDDRCRYLVQRTWKAINPKNGLESTCTQDLRLEDHETPKFSFCPPDISIDPGYNCETTVSWATPVATDLCGLQSLESSHQPGAIFSKGTTSVIYLATDSCGLTNVCMFTVTVSDQCCDRNPVLNCPPDFESCPGSSLSPFNTGEATATPRKSSCRNPRVWFTDRVISQGPCAGAVKLERTWIAEDPELDYLHSECIQIIVLTDREAPVINNMPDDIILNAQGHCEVELSWTPPTAADNCGLASLDQSAWPGIEFGKGKSYVYFTATDRCGNQSRDSFSVEVVGTEISLSCPRDTAVVRTNPFINGAMVDWAQPEVQYCTPCIDQIPGFVYMGELNGHRYFCSTGGASWEEARIKSISLGGHLAIINDAEENSFVASKLNGQTAWLGGSDQRVESVFEWLDKSPMLFTQWMPGQPNNALNNENFIEMFPDGTWNDQNGSAIREYVVELKCFDLIQIKGTRKGEMTPCGENIMTYVATKENKSDTCSFVINVDCDRESVYCKTKAMNSTYMFIDRVEFAGVDKVSGDNGGYAYFNSPCGIVENNQEYSICFSPGFLSSAYMVYWKAWIDFNADGFFDPLTEEVVRGYGNTKMCANITMPASMPDKLTRMRVIMNFSGYPASPCTAPLFGEVEDYCLVMNGGGGFGTTGKEQQLKIKTVELKAQTDEENNGQLHTGGIDGSEVFEIGVFPIPSSSVVYFESSGEYFFEMEVYNQQGKQVFKTEPNKSKRLYEIKVETWAPGIYNSLCRNSKGETRIKRFIVKP